MILDEEEGPEAGIEGSTPTNPTGVQLEGVWREGNHRRSHDGIEDVAELEAVIERKEGSDRNQAS